MSKSLSQLVSLIFASRSSFCATLLFFVFLYIAALTLDVPIEDFSYRPHYLTLHTFLELAAVLPSFAIFTLGSATIQSVRKRSIIVLSAFSLCAAFLDIGHILSYPGMPEFVTSSSTDKGIYFWLASRITDSVGFFIVALLALRTEIKMSSLSLNRASRFCFPLAILYIAGLYYVILSSPHLLPMNFPNFSGHIFKHSLNPNQRRDCVQTKKELFKGI